MIKFIKQLKCIGKMCGSPVRREKQDAIHFTEHFGYFKHIVMKSINHITKKCESFAKHESMGSFFVAF